MAGLLFVYTRTSIKAAKRNAQLHREADGGQINWQNENLRRHGMIEKPAENGKGDAAQVVQELGDQIKGEEKIMARALKKKKND
jgi:hypothetical protein